MVVKSDNYVKNKPLLDSDVAIIVPTYQGHLPFLKQTLKNYMKSGKYVVCSYDRHNDTPPNDIMEIPHSWVFKHKTYGAEKRNGWLWDIVYASGLVGCSFFDFVVIANGDCIWDKPEGIDYLTDYLGGHDLMSASSNGLIHTCNIIFRSEVFLDFVIYIIAELDRNIPESYSPEVLLKDFVRSEKCIYKNLPVQPIYPKGHFYEGKIDHYSSYNQDSTWKEILGYRNLGGEHKAACQEHLEPLPKKYFDLRDNGRFFNKHEQDTLYKYLITNDRRWLYKYWSEGEDSYWNRRYYPIEYYGKEPLYDDSRRKELGPPSERLGHFNRWKYNSFILKDDEYYSKWKKVIKGE